MGTKMYHPDLPNAEIDVVDPRGVAIHRQSGWRTEDEMPKGAKKVPAEDNKE
jgi:hypothetical protein